MCEFMTTPLSGIRQGNPDFMSGHDLTGTLSLVRFFGVSKEMNRKFFKSSDSGLSYTLPYA